MSSHGKRKARVDVDASGEEGEGEEDVKFVRMRKKIATLARRVQEVDLT